MKPVCYVIPPKKQMKSESYVISEIILKGSHYEGFAVWHKQELIKSEEKVKEILNTDSLKVIKLYCKIFGNNEMEFLLFSHNSSPSNPNEIVYQEKYCQSQEELKAIHKLCSRFSKNDRR